jgi:regulator of protease activity HflC (stomatin/prohibitin superfamily)
MGLLRQRVSVKHNQTALLFRRNIFQKKLTPGIHKIFDPFRYVDVYVFPLTTKMMLITNQEVLSKDNVAFRYSYSVTYKMVDPDTIINFFDVDNGPKQIVTELERRLHLITQVYIRNAIAALNSDEINASRATLIDNKVPQLAEKATEMGIQIEDLIIRDLTFPNKIQELFARQLEAKIRAKAELENARTTVASARALKNAADMMRENNNIKFMQYLETLTKIAAKGNHTFVLGSLEELLHENQSRSK